MTHHTNAQHLTEPEYSVFFPVNKKYDPPIFEIVKPEPIPEPEVKKVRGKGNLRLNLGLRCAEKRNVLLNVNEHFYLPRLNPEREVQSEIETWQCDWCGQENAGEGDFCNDLCENFWNTNIKLRNFKELEALKER